MPGKSPRSRKSEKIKLSKRQHSNVDRRMDGVHKPKQHGVRDMKEMRAANREDVKALRGQILDIYYQLARQHLAISSLQDGLAAVLQARDLDDDDDDGSDEGDDDDDDEDDE